MPTARKEIVSEGTIGIYHCISRCVRQAFLCGLDQYSGRSYEHRKDWVKSRLIQLADGFAVDVFSYAVMSNHLHVVIRNRPDIAAKWTDEEVARKWLDLFPAGVKPDNPVDMKNEAVRLARNEARMTELRERLSSVSWFMRCLNEHIARRANREDGCKGRFWEGRFKSQALLDESAVLACMAYVDLNPIRSGIAETPETSFFTSVHDRIMSRRIGKKSALGNKAIEATSRDNTRGIKRRSPAEWLVPFADEAGIDEAPVMDMRLDEYLNLVDWTGRLIRGDGKASMSDRLAPILTRISIDADSWSDTVQGYGRLFHRAVGRLNSMVRAAQQAGLRWFGGIKNCARAFSAA